MIKTFKAKLILNWKTGDMRLRKRGTQKTNYAEIPINVSIDVEIPEDKEHVISGKIALSERKVGKIVLSDIIFRYMGRIAYI